MLRSKRSLVLILAALCVTSGRSLKSQTRRDTVAIQSGALRLHGLLWRPPGKGPFPAVLFSHGSGPADIILRADRIALADVFVRHGYVFLYVHRRGAGLSASQGQNSFDAVQAALDSAGQKGRNETQLRLLEQDDLNDAKAGLAFLRQLRFVDRRRIVLAGHSFGGSLTLILSESTPSAKASVVFAPAAGSWLTSTTLQNRLRHAVLTTHVPTFFVHAGNDFSIEPGVTLAAEMKRAGKRYRLRIYPASGSTADDGHDFLYRDVPKWEGDVFEFLDRYMK